MLSRKKEAEAFVRKCDMAASPQRVAPILPMLVGHVFGQEALSLLKGKGILAVTLRNLFGEELANALRDLVEMLTDLGKTISTNPDQLRSVLKSISKIQGASNNLLGALFELVAGGIAKDVEGGNLIIGEHRKNAATGQEVEIDVQLDRGANNGGVLVIECKAKNPRALVSEKDIKRWYSDRVPLIHSILSKDKKYADRKFHFELWSNGQFTKSGLSWLKAEGNDCGDYTVDWKDEQKLKTYADRAKNKSLRRTLTDHYFKSPLKNR